MVTSHSGWIARLRPSPRNGTWHMSAAEKSYHFLKFKVWDVLPRKPKTGWTRQGLLPVGFLFTSEGLETLNDLMIHVMLKRTLRNSCSVPLIFQVAPGDLRELGDLAWLKLNKHHIPSCWIWPDGVQQRHQEGLRPKKFWKLGSLNCKAALGSFNIPLRSGCSATGKDPGAHSEQIRNSQMLSTWILFPITEIPESLADFVSFCDCQIHRKTRIPAVLHIMSWHMEAVNLAHQILDGKLEDLPDMGEARITWIAYPKNSSW